MRKRTQHHTHKPSLLKKHIYLIVIAILSVGALAGVLSLEHTPTRSVEVSFTDASPDGMQIVPASCASPPPQAPSNGQAYQISNGVYNKLATGPDGSQFCVTNSGGPTYFFPDKTPTEFHDFYNAIPHLSGLSQTAD